MFNFFPHMSQSYDSLILVDFTNYFNINIHMGSFVNNLVRILKSSTYNSNLSTIENTSNSYNIFDLYLLSLEGDLAVNS